MLPEDYILLVSIENDEILQRGENDEEVDIQKLPQDQHSLIPLHVQDVLFLHDVVVDVE